MERQNVRVLLASEHPEKRTFLRQLVETEDKAVIVAEAENGTRTLNLARTLRPDVVLIDSYLPYAVGIDNIPLSHIGGLDIAQSISEEMPNMRAVLLNRLDDLALADSTWSPGVGVSLCRESKDTCIPFTLSELSDQVVSPGALIFANVEPKAEAAPLGKASLSDKMLLAGILGVIIGWLMILTVFLATIGIYVLLAGVTAALLGWLGKVSRRVFKKSVTV